MPAQSKSQYRLMAMIAHKKGIGGLRGITKKVAKDFVKKTSKRKRTLFSRG